MNVDFLTAIKLYFANYVNFQGRSTRAEYWFAYLFVLIVSMVLSFLGLKILSCIFTLAVALPGLSITVRRFHDAGKSGWMFGGLWLAGVIGGLMMYGPMLASIIKFATDPEAMQYALTNYITSHVGLFISGLIIILIAFIVQLIVCVKPSAPDNQYGPNPYGNINS